MGGHAAEATGVGAEVPDALRCDGVQTRLQRAPLGVGRPVGVVGVVVVVVDVVVVVVVVFLVALVVVLVIVVVAAVAVAIAVAVS